MDILKERTAVVARVQAVAVVVDGRRWAPAAATIATAAAAVAATASGGRPSIMSDLIVGVVAPGQFAVRAPVRIGFGVQLGIVHPAIILY